MEVSMSVFGSSAAYAGANEVVLSESLRLTARTALQRPSASRAQRRALLLAGGTLRSLAVTAIDPAASPSRPFSPSRSLAALIGGCALLWLGAGPAMAGCNSGDLG